MKHFYQLKCFTPHNFENCIELTPACIEGRCPLCNGGLASCRVCNGAEVTLTFSCPGVPMTRLEQDLVTAGRLDFVNGEWYNEPLMPKPIKRRKVK